MDNVTGKLVKKSNLKMVIYASSLPEVNKFNAIGDFEKCSDEKFIWPKPLNQYKGVDQYIQEVEYILQLNNKLSKT